MRIITREDIRDIYVKARQRGLKFLSSKLTPKDEKRTQSAFNETHILAANWWIVPAVRERWNRLTTGNPAVDYETYLCHKLFRKSENLKILSLGSGVASHELKIASLRPDWEIHCYDFSGKLLETARRKAEKEQIKNISFHEEDVLKYQFPEETYDMVFFHASLHHFKDVNSIINQLVLKTLKPGGHLVINEYVGKNRMQYSSEQIKEINKGLALIPRKYRNILGTGLYKNRYYGSGILRMYIADPSECVDSESILPAIHSKFTTVIERPYGGNILMSCLKDIAHHFLETDPERLKILEELMALEDDWLKSNQSDFVFGVYRTEP